MSTLDQIKKKAIPILKEAGVGRCALFGSIARGEERDNSDIDMLIEAPEEMSLLDMAGLKIDLEEALGKKVDLVEYSTIKPRLKPYILSDQLQIL